MFKVLFFDKLTPKEERMRRTYKRWDMQLRWFWLMMRKFVILVILTELLWWWVRNHEWVSGTIHTDVDDVAVSADF